MEDKRIAEQKILWRSIMGTAAIAFIWVTYLTILFLEGK